MEESIGDEDVQSLLNQTSKGNRPICGFWQRILALIIDSIILGIIGMVLGLFMGDYFAKIGAWGRLIGFVIAISYFGILNSKLGNGQTLGKRIAKIRVTDSEGKCIAIGRAFLRSSILLVPHFLNNIMLPPSALVSPIVTVLGLLVFGLGGGIFYFYIFNRGTRQSLHDLVCKTYVVKTRTEGPITVPAVARIHYVVFSVYIAVILIFIFVIGPRIASMELFTDLADIIHEICKIENVSTTNVIVGKRISRDGTTTYLTASVWVKTKPSTTDEWKAAVGEVAKVILEKYPEAYNKDILQVKVNHGYDIGIFNFDRNYAIAQPPAEWRSRLSE